MPDKTEASSSSSKPAPKRTLPPELEAEYVNEEHILAFAKALEEDEINVPEHDPVMSPDGASTPSVPPSPRIRKVSALSDFAPVNLKVSKRRRRDKPQDKRQDWLYVLLRWPLLFFLFSFIMGEFSMYVLIRQLVNTKEWLVAWRGRKGVLRKRLRASRTYQEWKDAAICLDEHLQFQEWKQIDEDPFYDYKLVRKVRRSLKALRERNDARGVLGVLETSIRNNFAGVESTRLYSETFLGTKDLIESYFTEQEKALEFIRESPDLTNDEKKRFFKSANTQLGSSALCLSGGGSFGYYHVGVVKAFLDAGLLPRVMSGTSAGGLIAALVCTRTDPELKRLLVPEMATRISACEDPFRVWFRRFWTTGARFDAVSWARKATFFTRGSLTFKEAYVRTGRILNISVIPADKHSPTALLNWITSPDTVIWSALLASAAVPGILNPVVLMQKLKDGRVVPQNWGSKFKDGSLRVDIPVQALNLYFNVTHPVVSQCNPHVHLFFFQSRGSPGKPVAHRKNKGWRGNFLLSAAEQWLKLELTKNFKVHSVSRERLLPSLHSNNLKVIRDLELLPQLLGQDWSSVFLQRFNGTVTLSPRTRAWDWLNILSDPDPKELERMIKVGQMAAWPRLHIISNRHRLEQQIFMGRQAIRKAMQNKATRELPAEVQTVGEDDRAKGGLRGNRPPCISVSPTNDSDIPSGMDTETEAAFRHGAQWFQRQEHRSRSPKLKDTDPLRSSMLRRKWTTELLNGASSSKGVASPSGAVTPPKEAIPTPSGFFNRLRTSSLTTLSSPFKAAKSAHTRESSVDPMAEDAWSSESSESDEFVDETQRHVRYPSVANFQDSASSPEEGGEGR